jgi:hypothetical protein
VVEQVVLHHPLVALAALEEMEQEVIVQYLLETQEMLDQHQAVVVEALVVQAVAIQHLIIVILQPQYVLVLQEEQEQSCYIVKNVGNVRYR